MRMTTYTYPYGSDDSQRDYLVLHHMAAYHEFPLTGPFAAVTRSRNSPTYYYLFLPFILIKDDPSFIREINIIFQIITIFIIFKLAKRLFGLETAVMTSIIFSFNLYSLLQSAFLWQPWAMQPFVNLSYLMLLISYQKQNYKLLLCSALCFVFAGSLHISAFALTPLFVVLSIIILKSQKATLGNYLGFIGIMLLSYLAFFTPVFIAFSQNPIILPPLSSSNILGIYTPWQFISNLAKNIPYFIGGNIIYVTSSNTLNYLLALVILPVIILYLISIKQKIEKIYSLSLLSSFIIILFFLSVVNIRILQHLYGIHYYTPVYGLYIILLSRAVIFMYTKNKFNKTLAIFFFSIYAGFFLTNAYLKFYKNAPNFYFKKLNDPAINNIKTTVISLKKSNKYSDYSFFKIESPEGDNSGWKYNATVWAVLEKELGARLVKIDDYNQQGFNQLNNNPDYIFLICATTSTIESDGECMAKFSSKYRNYTFYKNTYLNNLYRIDLMRHKK